MTDKSANQTDDQTSDRQSLLKRVLVSIGPAFIVASVVLGPGSISISSKVGARFGSAMVWLVIVSSILMAGMMVLGARLGVVLKGTLCEELATRIGRPFSIVIGLTLFGICAGFQFGNNVGVLTAIDSMFAESESDEKNDEKSVVASQIETKQAESENDQPSNSIGEPKLQKVPSNGFARAFSNPSNWILFLINGLAILFMFASKRLYVPIERIMIILVALMILAFFSNFGFLLLSQWSTPDVGAVTIEKPSQLSGSDLLMLIGLIGTTFSVAGAFYQAYLVREKQWTDKDLKKGVTDSFLALSILGSITIVIMLTSAIAFYGKDISLKSAGDVARQLEPLFGKWSTVLFCMGLFSAAFSSFLVNAMIGGAMLSDGLGFGGKMDGTGTKLFTALALIVGMISAVFIAADDRIGLIVFAQSMVVIGFPILAGSMVYLSFQKTEENEKTAPIWMSCFSIVGFLVVLAIALRVMYSIVIRFTS